MAYASTSDVQACIGAFYTLSVSSSPSTTQVSAWLDQASAIVDAILTTRGYGTIPATGSNDVNMLKEYVANYVALKTLYTAFGYDNVPESMREMLSGWNEFLLALSNNTMGLVDQSPRARMRTIAAKVYGVD